MFHEADHQSRRRYGWSTLKKGQEQKTQKKTKEVISHEVEEEEEEEEE